VSLFLTWDWDDKRALEGQNGEIIMGKIEEEEIYC
jgi:hypothetical protein